LFAWRLKKRVLSEWVSLWWEARKEWALCIRADLHYRFVISIYGKLVAGILRFADGDY